MARRRDEINTSPMSRGYQHQEQFGKPFNGSPCADRSLGLAADDKPKARAVASSYPVALYRLFSLRVHRTFCPVFPTPPRRLAPFRERRFRKNLQGAFV